MPSTPRYLVAFHPKRSPHRFTDVLIIGSGLAGLRAANAVSQDLDVLVVTKGQIEQSNSHYAQGGIAGVIDPEDRFENHVADTIEAGGELCDPAVVESVIRGAPNCIDQLVEWGARFDRKDGELILGREGGHSHFRVVHALGDATGKEIMRAMIETTHQRENVEVCEKTFTLDLLTDESGACCGALIANHKGKKTMVWAKQTILCTGGAGQIYRETTNPPVATADGHALAFRAGVEIRDMEFMQFHPTVLYIAGSSRSLITEAMRGEGARLVDRNDYRFMADYDPRLELAPRDIVSQAIVNQMEKTRHPNVYLDLSHLDAGFVHRRFPGISAACGKFGINIASDLIPVRPGAHYMIGGVTVDEHGQTSVPGLWAAGEATSTGLHGANRLASNSLVEALVYGKRAGEAASVAAAAIPDSFKALSLGNPPAPAPDEPLDISDISNSLKSLMWRNAGVRRAGEQLEEAAGMIDNWRTYVLSQQFKSREGWELQNMLTIARLMVAAMLRRNESRGVHLRTDCPGKAQDGGKKHVTFHQSLEPEYK